MDFFEVGKLYKAHNKPFVPQVSSFCILELIGKEENIFLFKSTHIFNFFFQEEQHYLFTRPLYEGKFSLKFEEYNNNDNTLTLSPRSMGKYDNFVI